MSENKESNNIKKSKDIKIKLDLSKYVEIEKSDDLVIQDNQKNDNYLHI